MQPVSRTVLDLLKSNKSGVEIEVRWLGGSSRSHRRLIGWSGAVMLQWTAFRVNQYSAVTAFMPEATATPVSRCITPPPGRRPELTISHGAANKGNLYILTSHHAFGRCWWRETAAGGGGGGGGRNKEPGAKRSKETRRRIKEKLKLRKQWSISLYLQ